MTREPATRSLPEERLAVACLALLLVITLVNVVARYFTSDSVGWSEEISVFVMVVLTLAGSSAVARRDRHIRIELLFSRRDAEGNAVPRPGLLKLAALANCFTFLLLGALFVRWVADQVRYGETSMGLNVPLWWYSGVVPPLCLAIAVRSFVVYWRARREPQP